MTEETKPVETKNEKFKRLAKARTRRVVKQLELLGNLAGPGYEHTEAHLAQMYAAIEMAYGKLQVAFADASKPEEFDFDNMPDNGEVPSEE